MSEPEVISEESYLARHGVGFNAIGDPSLHRQPRSTPKSRHQAAKRQAALDAAVCERRDELRREYAEKVAAGEIRPPSRLERLKRTAAGHPDNPSVQAARRILKQQYGLDV